MGIIPPIVGAVLSIGMVAAFLALCLKALDAEEKKSLGGRH